MGIICTNFYTIQLHYHNYMNKFIELNALNFSSLTIPLSKVCACAQT